MARSEAVVATPAAGRYLVQLCKHWSHRFVVTFDTQRGHIAFDGASCLMKADDASLHVIVEAPDVELERVQGVVASHLNRFAHREGELVFDWRRAA